MPKCFAKPMGNFPIKLFSFKFNFPQNFYNEQQATAP
jgi:hypothetical protein